MNQKEKTILRITRYRRNLKLKCVKYKGGKCIKCGYNKCIAALEFHHRDPNEKDFSFSHGYTKSWAKTKEEIDKCDLLCSNCHKEVHWKISEFIFQAKLQKLEEHTERKVAKTRICKVCKKEFKRSKEQKVYYCGQNCREIGTTKIKWPPSVQLLGLVKATSFAQVSRDLGVSDHSIRKRLKRDNLI